MKPIYLDHAATTPLAPEAYAAMRPWLQEYYGNPASDHAFGRLAKQGVERARAQVAALLGAAPEEILFTSGATESNNLAIKGALEFRGLEGAHLVTARTEHKCVLDTVRYLESHGLRVTWLKPDAEGVVRAETVLAALTPATAMVSLMWVNNELGSINPVQQLAPLLRERGVLFHVDAVQAAGKLAINLAETPIDLLSVSAHKLYGPKGVGALFGRRTRSLAWARPFVSRPSVRPPTRPTTRCCATVSGRGCRPCRGCCATVVLRARRTSSMSASPASRARPCGPCCRP
jgi:cysteine desulfurase